MHKVQRDWESWRNKVRARLPELAHRVFALRDRFYSGCGFHYEMERHLGGVMTQASDFVNRKELPDWLCLQVCVQMLVESIVRAERSANQLRKERENDDGNRDKDQEANPGHAGV